MKSPIQNFFLFLWTFAFIMMQGCVPAANNLSNKSVIKGICLYRGSDGKAAKIPVDSELKNDLAYTTDGAWIGCETAYTKRPINIFRLKPGQTCSDIDQNSNATSDLFPIGEKVKVVRSNVAYETSADGKTQIPSCERIALTQVTVNGQKGCASTVDLSCDSPFPANAGVTVTSVLSGMTTPVKMSQCKGFIEDRKVCGPDYTLRQVTDSPRGIYWSPASMIGMGVSKDFPTPCIEDGEPPSGPLDWAVPAAAIFSASVIALMTAKGKNVGGHIKYPLLATAAGGVITTGVLMTGEMMSANIAKGKLQSFQAGACICASNQVKEVGVFRPLLTAQNIITSPTFKGTQSYREIEGIKSANGKKCFVSAEDILKTVAN